MNRTSLLYWYPKIKRLGIPMPKTRCVNTPNVYSILDGKLLPDKTPQAIIAAGRAIGYPLFLRTDLMSGKHLWEDTCYVPDEKALFRHIFAVVEDNACKSWGENDPVALVFREYIPLVSAFTAFKGLPIAKERRYFVRDGKAECHHAYWFEGAIEQWFEPPSELDWRDLLEEMNREEPAEVVLLTDWAERVGAVLRGYWSVDFALAQDGRWLLIDMAEGARSWHPEHEEVTECLHT